MIFVSKKYDCAISFCDFFNYSVISVKKGDLQIGTISVPIKDSFIFKFKPMRTAGWADVTLSRWYVVRRAALVSRGWHKVQLNDYLNLFYLIYIIHLHQ